MGFKAQLSDTSMTSAPTGRHRPQFHSSDFYEFRFWWQRLDRAAGALAALIASLCWPMIRHGILVTSHTSSCSQSSGTYRVNASEFLKNWGESTWNSEFCWQKDISIQITIELSGLQKHWPIDTACTPEEFMPLLSKLLRRRPEELPSV